MALTTENNSNNPNLKNLRKPTLELDEGLTVAGKNEYAEEDYTLEKDKTELTEPVQVAGLGKKFTKGLLKGASGVKETVSKGAKKVGETVDKAVDYFDDAFGNVDATLSPAERNRIKNKKEDAVKLEKQAEEGSPIVVTDEGEAFVKPMSAEDFQSVTAYMKQNIDFDVVLPNLNKIDSKLNGDTADVQFKKLIAATYEHFKKQKSPEGDKILRAGPQYKDGQKIDRGNKTGRTFQNIISDANKIGSVDIMLSLLKRKPGERPFTDSELLAAKRTVLSFQILAQKHMNQFEKSGSELDLAKAYQALNISGYAQIQLVGVQEDIARTLVSNKIIASPGKSRIAALRTWADTNKIGDFTAVLSEKNLAEYIEANGGQAAMQTMLAAYKALPNDISKNKFLRMTMLERTKMVPRGLVEIYTSALLSSGVTHAYNTVSQFAFYETLMIENFLSGNYRKAFNMLKGHVTYLPQALRNMGYALVHEKSLTENISKLDFAGRTVTRQGFGLKSRLHGEDAGVLESATSLAIDGFGITMRALGYRPMIAIDEFFKTMARGVEIETIGMKSKSDAFRNKQKEILEKITNEGTDVDTYSYTSKYGDTETTFTGNEAVKKEAADFANETYLRVINSDDTFRQGNEFARMLTFQDDLPGLFQKVTPFFNHPLVKIWVPFFKTPSQIVRRVSERTPLALMMPSFYQKIIGGNSLEKREALVKLSTGSAMFATLATVGTGSMDEGMVITGYGPRDGKIRKRWLENHRPYSIGIRKKNEDGTYKEGLDAWTWISYSRYDPISGMLAMAGDFNDAIFHVNDEDTITDMLIGAGAATMRYTATALPMTQFIGELVDLAGSPFASHEKKVERVIEVLSKQVFNAGSVVKEHVMSGGFNGIQLKGSLERSGHGPGAKFGNMTLGSEYASNTMADNQYDDINIPFWNRPAGLQPIVRAWYENLNNVASKTPGLSSKLPPGVNRWYEPMPQTRGSGWEFISPIKVIDLPHANLINTELDKLNLALPPITRSIGEPQLKLNGEQMNRYIELYNYPSRGIYAKEYFKTEVYAGGDALMPKPIIQEFKKTIDADGYNFVAGFRGREPAPRSHKIKLLKGVDNAHKKYAKEMLVLEYPELKALLMQRDEFQKEFGENPRNLSEPDIFDLEKAIKENRKSIR